MEKGKEYYLSVGRHASIVRKNDDYYKKLIRDYPDNKKMYDDYYKWVNKGMESEIKDRKKNR